MPESSFADFAKTPDNTLKTIKMEEMKMEIKGTTHKENSTDFSQACKSCHRLFYFSRNSNGATVVCPYCKTKH